MTRIRPATLDDRLAIWSLHTASIRRLCTSCYSVSQVERWVGFLTPDHYTAVITDGQRHLVVAEVSGQVVAFGQLNLSAAEVEAIYVHPDHVRAGIGREIMRHLEQLAHNARLPSLHLTATLNAVPFYENRGFRVTGQGEVTHPSGVVLACTFMAKTIESAA